MIWRKTRQTSEQRGEQYWNIVDSIKKLMSFSGNSCNKVESYSPGQESPGSDYDKENSGILKSI